MAGCLLLSFVVGLAGAPAASGEPLGPGIHPHAIFGADDRHDVYEETDPIRLQLARSTCAVIDASRLTDNGNGTFTITTNPWTVNGDPPCASEPYASQPQAAFCSCFLTGAHHLGSDTFDADIVVTAGHCVDPSNLVTSRFVFGFEMADATTPIVTVPAANVYSGQQFVAFAYDPPQPLDLAEIWLDRPVTAVGVAPLAIDDLNTFDVSAGEAVGVIGHPAGLPKKIAFGSATQIYAENPIFFVANLDTYGGNSGSPVFDAASGVVTGILVRGIPDFVDMGSCFSSNVVSDDSAASAGEEVTAIQNFAGAVPQYGTMAGQAPELSLEDGSTRRKRNFGWELTGLPDVNGDGFGDVLVSAPFGSVNPPDLQGPTKGQVFIFDGVSGALLRTLENTTGFRNTFGGRIAGLHDLDADGRGDVAVLADTEQTIYVFSGATGDVLAMIAIPPVVFNATALAATSDLDGDGKDDLVLGSGGTDGTFSGQGRVFIYSPSTGLAIRTIDSPNAAAFGRFGWSVASIPDADGDGVTDILVGAPSESPGGGPTGAGRAYVFSGATGSVLATLAEPTPGEGRLFGSVVSGVPDLDGDGRGDVIVAALPPTSGDHNDLFVFSGATGALIYVRVVPGPRQYDDHYPKLVGASDVDGDGRGDFVVGASAVSAGTMTSCGGAFVYSGATGNIVGTLASAHPERGGRFGSAVGVVPDTDGDGVNDIAVGGGDEDPDGVPINDGRAYLFGPIETPTTTATVSPTPTATSTTTPTSTPTPTSTATPAIICPPTPAGGCHVAAQAQIQAGNKPGKERLNVQWKKLVDATTQAAFGDPVNGTTAVGLCLYDDGDALVESLVVDRAGRPCAGKPCWSEKPGKSYAYKDKTAASDGITRLGYSAGFAGKGKASAAGANNGLKGQTSLPTGIVAALSHSANPTVQLTTSTGFCVTATMTQVTKNDGSHYQAKR